MKRTILILALWALATRGGACAEPPVTRLLYRPVPTLKQDKAAVDYPRLLAMMEKRCNPGFAPRARFRQLDDGRIEVGVYWHDIDQVARIDRAFREEVTLEVRVLASTRVNAELVARARKSKDRTLLDGAGKRIAWWAPVPARRHNAIEGSSDRVMREAGGGGIEVLVLADGYALSADDIRSAWPGQDRTGRPSVAIGLSQTGTEHLNKLIGGLLPDPRTDFHYRVATIINSSVYGTPVINGRIGDSIEISATDLTCEEVEVLAGILDSGPIPVRLERIQDAVEVPGLASGSPRRQSSGA